MLFEKMTSKIINANSDRPQRYPKVVDKNRSNERIKNVSNTFIDNNGWSVSEIAM